MKNIVHIVSTGGTIDKTYSEIDGTLENRESIMANQINAQLRLPYKELKIHCLINKDSLNFTPEDRVKLANYLDSLALSGRPIIVLHGTDTMHLSIKEVFETCKSLTAPIIFTGAMKPMGFYNSDALQNVTESLACSEILDPGVYLCFHSKVFKAPNIAKNRTTLTFESC